MPLVSTAACNEDLTALIQGPIELTLIYSYINRISTVLGVEHMQSPIPIGTDSIDHIKRNLDRLTITGFLGCAGCSEATSPVGIIKMLKEAISQIVYSSDNFYTITTNRAQYSKMILTNVDVVESSNKLQFMEITTQWVGANLAGTVTVPSFEAGGVFA